MVKPGGRQNEPFGNLYTGQSDTCNRRPVQNFRQENRGKPSGTLPG